jgi:hypothetical protein
LTIEAVRDGKPSPISFDELVEITETTLVVQQALATGDVIRLAQAGPGPAPEASIPETRNAVQRPSDITGDRVCA